MKHSCIRVWKPISSIRVEEARKGNKDTRAPMTLAPKGVESLEGEWTRGGVPTMM